MLLAGATLNISVPIAAWPPAPVERRSAQSQRNDTNSSDQSLKGSDRRAPGSYIPREGSSLGSIYSVSAVPPTCVLNISETMQMTLITDFLVL